MKVKRALAISVVVILAAAALPSPKSDAVMTPREPTISAASPEAAGRYLVRVGGCNDCHTPGFAMLG